MRLIAIVVALALAAPIAVHAAAADTRAHTGFTGVGASGRYRVEVVQAANYGVTVEGPDAARIETSVEGRTLHIRPNNRPWFGVEPAYDVVVRVSAPTITDLSIARGGQMRATLTETSTLDLSAAMGAELDISGACGNLDVSAAMGAQIDAHELACRSVDASASMGGDMRVHATESVDASASMGGSIRVTGAPARRETNASMGGDISIR